MRSMEPDGWFLAAAPMRSGHRIEALGDDVAEDLVLVPEMPIGRGTRNAGEPAGFGQKEFCSPRLTINCRAASISAWRKSPW